MIAACSHAPLCAIPPRLTHAAYRLYACSFIFRGTLVYEMQKRRQASREILAAMLMQRAIRGAQGRYLAQVLKKRAEKKRQSAKSARALLRARCAWQAARGVASMSIVIAQKAEAARVVQRFLRKTRARREQIRAARAALEEQLRQREVALRAQMALGGQASSRARVKERSAALEQKMRENEHMRMTYIEERRRAKGDKAEASRPNSPRASRPSSPRASRPISPRQAQFTTGETARRLAKERAALAAEEKLLSDVDGGDVALDAPLSTLDRRSRQLVSRITREQAGRLATDTRAIIFYKRLQLRNRSREASQAASQAASVEASVEASREASRPASARVPLAADDKVAMPPMISEGGDDDDRVDVSALTMMSPLSAAAVALTAGQEALQVSHTSPSQDASLVLKSSPAVEAAEPPNGMIKPITHVTSRVGSACSLHSTGGGATSSTEVSKHPSQPQSGRPSQPPSVRATPLPSDDLSLSLPFGTRDGMKETVQAPPVVRAPPSGRVVPRPGIGIAPNVPVRRSLETALIDSHRPTPCPTQPVPHGPPLSREAQQAADELFRHLLEQGGEARPDEVLHRFGVVHHAAGRGDGMGAGGMDHAALRPVTVPAAGAAMLSPVEPIPPSHPRPQSTHGRVRGGATRQLPTRGRVQSARGRSPVSLAAAGMTMDASFLTEITAIQTRPSSARASMLPVPRELATRNTINQNERLASWREVSQSHEREVKKRAARGNRPTIYDRGAPPFGVHTGGGEANRVWTRPETEEEEEERKATIRAASRRRSAAREAVIGGPLSAVRPVSAWVQTPTAVEYLRIHEAEVLAKLAASRARDDVSTDSRAPSPPLEPPPTAVVADALDDISARRLLLGTPHRKPMRPKHVFTTDLRHVHVVDPGQSETRRLAVLWDDSSLPTSRVKIANAEYAAWRAKRAKFRRTAGWRRRVLLEEGWQQAAMAKGRAKADLRYLAAKRRFELEDWAATTIQRRARGMLERRRLEAEMRLLMSAMYGASASDVDVVKMQMAKEEQRTFLAEEASDAGQMLGAAMVAFGSVSASQPDAA